MSDATQGKGGVSADAGSRSGRQLGMLLMCFSGSKAAGKARRSLDAHLKSQGDAPLDTVVLRVSAKQHASLYDPRHAVQGALTAALTWGVFGLLAGGLKSLALGAILGAVCGGLFAYTSEHLLAKNELARIGTRLPANSSALLTWAETSNPPSLLKISAIYAPAVASAAVIGDDLTTHVFAGAADHLEVPSSPEGTLSPDQAAPLSMIVFRYPGPEAAKQIASLAAPIKKAVPPVQVELVIWASRKGRLHVSDPGGQGVGAQAKSSLVSWLGLGLIVGALAGSNGGGVHSLVNSALVTSIAWAVFGLVVGALYGLWAGRSVSARRLKSVGPLVAPGTSILLAWAEKPITEADLGAFAGPPGSQRLVLRFKPDAGGAVLDTA